MKRLLVCGALLAAGCGRNAFLELEIDLPANPTGKARYAVIGIASGDRTFVGRWGGDGTLPGVLLATDKPTKQSVSVEGNSDSFDKIVEVKVVFCSTPECSDLTDDNSPEAHLTIERAFYEGKRTSYSWTIACIPTLDASCKDASPIEKTVKKCEVAGCRAGSSSSGYCVGDKHFCES